MEYLVIKETKSDKELIKSFQSKMEALDFIETYIRDYLLKKENEDRSTMDPLRKCSHNKSYSYMRYPSGYFWSFDEQNVYKKYVLFKKVNKGYLWNSYIVEQIFSLDLISVMNKYKQEKMEIEREFDVILNELDPLCKEYFTDEVLPLLKYKTTLNKNEKGITSSQ